MSGENVTALIVDEEFQSRNYQSKLMLHAAPEVKLVGRQATVRRLLLPSMSLTPISFFLRPYRIMKQDSIRCNIFIVHFIEVIFTIACNDFAMKS